MAKTVPQLVKIVDREDLERVSVNVEPYPWQRAPAAADQDPFHIATVRLPRADGKAPVPDKDKKRR